MIEKNKDTKAFCLIGNKRKFKAGVDFTTLQKRELGRSKSNDLEDSSIMHIRVKHFLKINSCLFALFTLAYSSTVLL